MKLLVTGAQGQLAKSLQASLRPDIEIVSLGRPALDISRKSTVETALRNIRPDIVVGAAAYTAVDQAEQEPDLAFEINAGGAENVARSCAAFGLPLIHISTDYVFDGTKTGPYREDDRPSPLGVYGASKRAGEEAVLAASDRAIVLRTSWVFSPYLRNFVKTMLRLAGERDEISVVDDQIGNPTYAPHLAEAVLVIAERLLRQPSDETPAGIYHAAGSGDATWCDLAVEVFACSERIGGPTARVRPIATDDYPTPARRPANSRLDCSALARDFGIRMPPWPIGVEQCLRQLLSR